MKLFQAVIVTSILVLATLCWAAVHVERTVDLPHGGSVKVRVQNAGLDKGEVLARAEFMAKNGYAGSITLYAGSPHDYDRSFHQGNQELWIKTIDFRDATDSQTGKFWCSGTITDASGGDTKEFEVVLAEWDHD